MFGQISAEVFNGYLSDIQKNDRRNSGGTLQQKGKQERKKREKEREKREKLRKGEKRSETSSQAPSCASCKADKLKS